jgi:uncharacterized OsmC-like protein
MSKLTDGKTWTLAVHAGAGGSRLLKAGKEVDLLDLAPVEQLLIATASCFAKTCVNLMQFHQMPSSGVAVDITGATADGPLAGKGLDRLSLGVRFDDGVLERNQQQRLVSNAKELCTVTNSLDPGIDVSVELINGTT